MNPSFALEIPAYIVSRQVDDQTAILDPSTGDHFGLDFVGVRIWELLAGGHTLGESCTESLTKFAVSTTDLERGLLELIKTLLARKVVRIAN